MTRSGGALASQPSFDDLEPNLSATAFVVVDLETTGGSARSDAITEIGAVKVRGGEVLGEFATLVDPGRAIPTQISLLTGITDEMVTGAPAEHVAVPMFLEFARGCALVAHNAPFDIGFLKAACARLGLSWPAAPVVDTVRLARRVFDRTELPSVRLAVLAAALGARTSPNHRALADARATVDVLHALIDRLGVAQAGTVSDLIEAGRAADPARRRKRHLADGLPAAPGVYLFRAADDSVLYVGTSGNLRSRVRSYFTAAETRRHIKDMVLAAARVDHVVCATPLEAAVRELRLIRAHRPPFNRRSKNPPRPYWVRLGAPGDRHVAVTPTRPPADQFPIGPFTSRSHGRTAAQAIRAARAADALREGRTGTALDAIHTRMRSLSDAHHYEQAAQARDELIDLIGDLVRAERLRSVATIDEIVTACPDHAGGWQITLIRRGLLAGVALAPRGVAPRPVAERLRATGAAPDPASPVTPPGEETGIILAHLERPEVRIVASSAGWCSPMAGVGRWREFGRRADGARSACGFDPR